MAAYRSRYVALEVAYLGQRYHGLASQANTEETIEVHALLAAPVRSIWGLKECCAQTLQKGELGSK